MEPCDGCPRLSLLGMPTEILSNVVTLAGPAVCPALRLTNKHLCAVSNEPFALKHFSERRHVPSAYSMDALINITAHLYFGKFVKTVIISGSRPEIQVNRSPKGVPRFCAKCPQTRYNPLCKNPAPHHLALNFERLQEKLDKTFSNIRRNSMSVCIGVCDSAYRCYGSAYYHADCSMISGQRIRLTLYSYARDECKDLSRSFDEVYQAALRSGCKIHGIKLDTFSTFSGFCHVPRHELQAQHLVLPLLDSETLNLELNFEMNHPGKPRSHLKFDHETGELDLSGLIFRSTPEPSLMATSIETLLSRLSTCSVTHIKLRDCRFEKSDLPWIFHNQTLRKLTLCNVNFFTEHFDTNLWSSILDQLARTTQLRLFEMSQCRYSFAGEERQDDYPFRMSPWFRLPSGVYESKNSLQWDSEFILAPSGDTNETIVLTDQTSISGQLKSLADQVAQLELDKIAEIERDGYVRTDIVGLFKDPQPEEDDVTGEDEEGSMEDDGSGEANNDRGEREGNDERDEHEPTVKSWAFRAGSCHRKRV